MKKSFLVAARLVASTCLFAQDAKLTPYSEHTNELLTLRTQQAYDKMIESYLLVSDNRHALDIARENYRLSGVNYRAGMGTITDLLTAQTSYLQAQNNLTDALISYRVNYRRYTDLTK